MFVLEALRAKHGDALLLHFGTEDAPRLAVIDAGPGGVFKDAVQPRLMEIRDERGLAEDEPLPIELMMVSHLDADHITGILELMRRLRDLKEARKPLPWKIERFWHNAFEDLTDDDDVAVASADAGLSTASAGDFLPGGASSLLASVGQGRELRDLVKVLKLDGNKPFNSIVKFPHPKNPVKLGKELELTVVGPDEQNLRALQQDWNKKVKELLKKEADKAVKAELAAYLDKSVYNLSSIVVLAKADGKTMLLTGDARGDYTLAAMRAAGLLKEGETLEVDLLKLPHHGSIRNTDTDYFRDIRARHYVISADGRHSNPDVATLQMLVDSREDDDFTIWLANAPDQFVLPEVGKAVAKFFADQKKAGRKFEVVYRDPDALGVTIEL